jgi:hypothetical protein
MRVPSSSFNFAMVRVDEQRREKPSLEAAPW